MIDKVRKWSVEHTGNEPSISCFYRALDDLQEAIAKPAPADKPAQITEQDARAIITRYALWRGTEYDESIARPFISGWLALEGNELIEKLNSTRASPSHSQQSAEQISGWQIALKVREALDRKACPDAFMRVAVEEIERLLCPSHESEQANQCDGCMAGMALKEGNLHMDFAGNSVMVCQADRYRV